MKLPLTCAALALAVVGCSPAPSPPRPLAATPTPPAVTVSQVSDGDTVKLSDGRTIRLLGIDTPERGDCGYREATWFANRTLLSKSVTVTPDPTQDATDRFGRTLAYLGVDGQDYSVAAARAGWARSYVYGGKPVQKEEEIAAAEAVARRQQTGIWGPLCVPVPAPAPTPTSAPSPAPQSQPDPAPRPTPAPAPAVYYPNCDAVRAAGAAPIRAGQPGYSRKLDRDGDGVGCE